MKLSLGSGIQPNLTGLDLLLIARDFKKSIMSAVLAPAFFWEDLVSFFVIALHTAYLITLIGGFLSSESQMWLALIAYAAYMVNALQFILKFRSGRTKVKGVAQIEGRLVT